MMLKTRTSMFALLAALPFAAAAQITPQATMPRANVPMVTLNRAQLPEIDPTMPPESFPTLAMPDLSAEPATVAAAPVIPGPPWTPHGTPAIYNDWLIQTYQLDLDGNRATSAPTADIWFQAIDPTHFALNARNGATIAALPPTMTAPPWPAVIAQCGTQTFTTGSAPMPFTPYPTGRQARYCVRTNAGHMVLLDLRSMVFSSVRPQGWPPGPPPIQMNFNTYVFPL